MMNDPMTRMFGPSLCLMCGYTHASGFDCVAEKRHSDERMARLAAKSLPKPRPKPKTPTKEPIYEAVGRAVYRLRRNQQLTQDAVAPTIGLTRTSLVNIEKGRQRIYLDQFIILIAVIDPSDTYGVRSALARMVTDG